MLFYDFEVFKYDWLLVAIDVTNKQEHVIVNDVEKLQELYDDSKHDVWVGYNSRNYDQYILKALLCGFDAKKMNDYIIVGGKQGWKFSSLLNNIPLNNYDIMTSFHGLKQLEGFMGNSIRESSVPFDIDRKLTPGEIEETVKYCRHDVEQTIEVFIQRKEEFESHLSLIKAFKLPLSYISKTKAQLSAIILGANKKSHNDEFEIILPNTLKVKKYKEIVNWYKNPLNRDYSKTFEIEVASVPHVFAWGGLHGALPKYSGEGYFINIDVASYYPALMIEYDFISRNIANPSKYREIRDTRLQLKAEKNPMQAPYKIVLNSTYGAMKDKNNALHDPRQANNVCVGGQLLLLDLIEMLEGHCQLIQSNTDGLIIKLFKEDDYEVIDDICYEWEQRTRMQLEFESYKKIFQKDVNNYVIVDFDGGYKSKGAYVKKWTKKDENKKEVDDLLDYDCVILRESVVNYFLHGIHPKQTIEECSELRKFQKIVKVSSKYMYALYNPTVTEEKIRGEDGKLKTVKVFTGGEIQKEKCFRVFASKLESEGSIFKVKNHQKNPEKFQDTPEHCFFINEDVNNARIPRKLDKNWYVDLAIKRLKDFGVMI
jgi:DNA polymerase